MKIRRDITSIPQRSAEETWSEYKSLVTVTGSVDVGQFDTAASIMASLITDEAFKDEPLTLSGVSHRLVVYLLHGSDALEVGPNIEKLSWNPTEGDWSLYVPCPEEQYDWVKKTLATRAPRFIVLKPGQIIEEDEGRTDSEKAAVSVNWGVFKL